VSRNPRRKREIFAAKAHAHVGRGRSRVDRKDPTGREQVPLVARNQEPELGWVRCRRRRRFPRHARAPGGERSSPRERGRTNRCASIVGKGPVLESNDVETGAEQIRLRRSHPSLVSWPDGGHNGCEQEGELDRRPVDGPAWDAFVRLDPLRNVATPRDGSNPPAAVVAGVSPLGRVRGSRTPPCIHPSLVSSVRPWCSHFFHVHVAVLVLSCSPSHVSTWPSTCAPPFLVTPNQDPFRKGNPPFGKGMEFGFDPFHPRVHLDT